jgi:hypothetical protein
MDMSERQSRKSAEASCAGSEPEPGQAGRELSLVRLVRNSGLLVGSLLFVFLGTGCDKTLLTKREVGEDSIG